MTVSESMASLIYSIALEPKLLVPILGALGLGLGLGGALIYFLRLRHVERMAMIEAGMLPPGATAPRAVEAPPVYPVYVSQPAWNPGPISPLSRLVALALCGFLGVFGLHRFYAGKIFTGLLLLLTGGGFGFWWMIDLVLILLGVFTDRRGGRLVHWLGPEWVPGVSV